MKVAIVSSLFAPFGIGGAEQVAAQIAEYLARDGHEVDVVSTGRRSDLEDADYRIESWKGLRVWRIAPWNLYWRFDREKEEPGRLKRAAWHAVDLRNPTVARPLAKVLERIRPDVVNTHNIDGLSPMAWQVARNFSPVVHTLHDLHLICPRATMQRRDGTCCPGLCRGCRVYASYHHLYQRYIDAMISPTHMVADLHRSAGWTTPEDGDRSQCSRHGRRTTPCSATGGTVERAVHVQAGAREGLRHPHPGRANVPRTGGRSLPPCRRRALRRTFRPTRYGAQCHLVRLREGTAKGRAAVAGGCISPVIRVPRKCPSRRT